MTSFTSSSILYFHSNVWFCHFLPAVAAKFAYCLKYFCRVGFTFYTFAFVVVDQASDITTSWYQHSMDFKTWGLKLLIRQPEKKKKRRNHNHLMNWKESFSFRQARARGGGSRRLLAHFCSSLLLRGSSKRTEFVPLITIIMLPSCSRHTAIFHLVHIRPNKKLWTSLKHFELF